MRLPLRAAPGDVLFSHDFESGFTNWTTSTPSNTQIPSLRVQAWIRRDRDSFSENPEKNEELHVEYLDANGADLPWLRYDWPEDGNLDGLFDDDPRPRATFGIWKGRDQLIFVREMYWA